MKTQLFSALTLALFLSISAYAQDSTATMSKKEEKAERKARMKQDLKNTGQAVGETASEAGQGIKRKAKVAGTAVDTAAHRVGRTVNRGLDKAENGIVTEGDKLKAKRDSSRAQKARRDSL